MFISEFNVQMYRDGQWACCYGLPNQGAGLELGTYEVIVVSHAGVNQVWNVEGRLRAHVAGKSVENKLIEDERVPICTMKSGTVDLQCVLGSVKINSAGAHTLSLEIASGLTGAKPKLRSVVLDPVTREK